MTTGKKQNRCKKCSGRTGGRERPRLKLHIQTSKVNLWRCPVCGHEVPRRRKRQGFPGNRIRIGGHWMDENQPIKIKDALKLLGIPLPSNTGV